jgi:putative lysine transport system ATP-binding protein
MGGYGAIKFGLKYPELFRFAGSLSGAFNAAKDLDSLRGEFRPSLLRAFGEDGSQLRSQNDIFALLNAPHQAAFPYFYLACGTADFFLATNRLLVAQLSARKMDYEYHETPGDHTWDYWDGALDELLVAVEDQLGKRH